MNIPPGILAKTLARFDSLIAEGRNIMAAAKDVPPKYEANDWTGKSYQSGGGYKIIDGERFIEWRTKTATILSSVIPKHHVHGELAKDLSQFQCSYNLLQSAVSVLRGIRDDLNNGFLNDMAAAIEAEIACDYMGQAEQLLAEGTRGKYDHVPAAVLSGAVLENALRKLCSDLRPPISLKDLKGNHKTLGPLIDELKRAGVFNEPKAKQLRAWADIRNLAAHGEFAKFTRGDVETMIAGVNSFLADHLK